MLAEIKRLCCKLLPQGMLRQLSPIPKALYTISPRHPIPKGDLVKRWQLIATKNIGCLCECNFVHWFLGNDIIISKWMPTMHFCALGNDI